MIRSASAEETPKIICNSSPALISARPEHKTSLRRVAAAVAAAVAVTAAVVAAAVAAAVAPAAAAASN